jgi:hypothetical protein
MVSIARQQKTVNYQSVTGYKKRKWQYEKSIDNWGMWFFAGGDAVPRAAVGAIGGRFRGAEDLQQAHGVAA